MKLIDRYIEHVASEPIMNKHSLFWGTSCIFLGVVHLFFAGLVAIYPAVFDDPHSVFALLLALMGAFWILVGKRLLEKWLVFFFKK
ncbi:MAG: hypothetical protein Q7S11_02575 [bacterium]|nr:hypothetical protein [bacterium]